MQRRAVLHTQHACCTAWSSSQEQQHKRIQQGIVVSHQHSACALVSLAILSANCPPHAWRCLKHEISHFFSIFIRWPNCHFGIHRIRLLTNRISNFCNDPQQLAQFEGQTMEKKSDTFFWHYKVLSFLILLTGDNELSRMPQYCRPPDRTWPALIFWHAQIKPFVLFCLVLFCFLEGLYFSLSIGLLLRSFSIFFITHNDRHFDACLRKISKRNKPTMHANSGQNVKKSSIPGFFYSTVEIRIGIPSYFSHMPFQRSMVV